MRATALKQRQAATALGACMSRLNASDRNNMMDTALDGRTTSPGSARISLEYDEWLPGRWGASIADDPAEGMGPRYVIMKSIVWILRM
jgi:hypothetical protein